MKIKLLITVCVCLLFSSVAANAQNNFKTFFAKFRIAVIKGDKTTLASLTKFTLELQYGAAPVKNRQNFLKRYDEIFNGEANAARCFKSQNPFKREQHYEVDCTSKNNPETSDDRPITYIFELTKKGWRFTGLDNINE